MILIALGSIVSSIVTAGAIWHLCSRPRLPLQAVGITFFLGFALAPLYTTILYAFDPPQGLLSTYIYDWFALSLFWILIPLSAVLIYAYRHEEFDTVLDGVVYLPVAMAGTNVFVQIYDTILIYNIPLVFGADRGISEGAIHAALLYVPTSVAIVILAAITGYYVGLAAFNRQQQGPIIIKGLLFILLLGIPYPLIMGAYWGPTWVEYLPEIIDRAIISVFQPIADIASAWLGVEIPYYEVFAFIIETGYALCLTIILYKVLFRYRRELRRIEQRQPIKRSPTLENLEELAAGDLADLSRDQLDDLFAAGVISSDEYVEANARRLGVSHDK